MCRMVFEMADQIEKPRGKGRPRLPQEQQMVNRGITLRADEWAALDRVAAERKITRAALIRELRFIPTRVGNAAQQG